MPGNHKDKTEMKKVITFSLGELFCGPGGLALGAKRAHVETNDLIMNIEHGWANDNHHDSCRTYEKNICNNKNSSVICCPVDELDFSKLPAITALAFGFPCNDFSVVGDRKGIVGKYGSLYKYGVEALNYFKPRWFFAENVSGLLSANNGRAFARILSDLENAGSGYNLTPHMYKFEEYGVPQCRHRIIIIGIEKNLGQTFQVPAPTTAEKPRTVRETLNNPPIPQNAKNNELTRQSVAVVERLKQIPPGRNVWNSHLPRELQLNVKAAKLSQIYKRLDPDKPAYTITGSGGGGTHGYHWSEPRALTNRERARLQTFPDSFVFQGSKESVRRQIGMAVPPIGAQAIIEAILKTFSGVLYKSVPSSFPQMSLLMDLFGETISR